LQAGGHRFDPGWLHRRDARFRRASDGSGAPAPTPWWPAWRAGGSGGSAGERPSPATHPGRRDGHPDRV